MIVVVGEALIDLIVEPSGAVRVAPGGGPYNAARTLGRLGADCAYLGVLSDDRFGDLLRDGLAEAGVPLGCPEPTSDPTTLAVAHLSGSGSATYRFYLDGTSLPALTQERATRGLPDRFDALHVGTLGIATEPTASAVEALVEQHADHAIVMLDPNCRPTALRDPAAYRARALRLLARADLLKVSDEDVDYLLPDGGFEAVVAPHLDRGLIVLHTAGSGPITVFSAAGTAQVPPTSGPIVDTVGAGDVFGATALWALLDAGWRRGTSLPADTVAACVATAATAAYLNCQRAGADPPTRDELRRAVAGG